MSLSKLLLRRMINLSDKEKTILHILEIEKDIGFLQEDHTEKCLSLLCKRCLKVVTELKEARKEDESTE